MSVSCPLLFGQMANISRSKWLLKWNDMCPKINILSLKVRFVFLLVPPNMSSSHLKKITTYPLVGRQYLNYPDTFHRMIWLTVPLHLWLCHPYQQLPVKIGWNDKFQIDTPSPLVLPYLLKRHKTTSELNCLLKKCVFKYLQLSSNNLWLCHSYQKRMLNFAESKIPIFQSFKIKRFWFEKPPDTLLMPISSSPWHGWQA